MVRTSSIAAALIALAACSKKADPPKPGAKDGTGTAAGTAAKPPADAAANVAGDGEPTAPPPAPTIRPGKGDCSPDYAPRPTRDPNPMCKIAGGTFLMGAPDDDQDAEDDERPQRKVTLSPYYLDQFEVTIGQVVHYLNAVGSNDCPTSAFKKCFEGFDIKQTPEGRFVAKAGTERLPIETATPEGMSRYCAWAGKQLPTEAQWEFAARHDPATGKDLKFPWGDAFEPKRANCDEPVCADGFERAAPVGSIEGGESPWGVHDLAGNAAEVVRDCYLGPYPACPEPCVDPLVEQPAGCKGQAYRTSGWSSSRHGVRVTMRQVGTGGGGFRCGR